MMRRMADMHPIKAQNSNVWNLARAGRNDRFDASDGAGTRWELAKPKWLRRFIAVRGHLGLWELPSDVAAEIKRQMSDD